MPKAKIKISAVRHNISEGLIQIKTNHGPNYVLYGEQVENFMQSRVKYIEAGVEETQASFKAALDFIRGN